MIFLQLFNIIFFERLNVDYSEPVALVKLVSLTVKVPPWQSWTRTIPYVGRVTIVP